MFRKQKIVGDFMNKYCILCKNYNSPIECEHCENGDSYLLSNDGKKIITEAKLEEKKKIISEYKTALENLVYILDNNKVKECKPWIIQAKRLLKRDS